MPEPIDSPKDEPRNFLDMRQAILHQMTLSGAKITPASLAKNLAGRYGLNRAALRDAVRRLVAAGVLSYSYEHGCSFLIFSYNRPVRVGRHLVLKPPGLHYVPAEGEVVVQIMPGASFGGGEHPTTRLALRGLEQVLRFSPWFPFNSAATVLDVGTGSGVLLLAAVCLGARGGVGLDVDACARFEAQKNARWNRIDDRVAISSAAVEDLLQPVSLIVANLRFPTLKQLAAHFSRLCALKGAVVLSGLHPEELPDALAVFRSTGFGYRWHADERGWVALVLQKKKQV